MRTEIKKSRLHKIIIALILAVIIEIICRSIWPYNETISMYIFMTQLLIVVGFMTFFTVKLINLMNKVFGADFCDEKYQFKRSLVVFVFTYLLHCTLYALVLAFMDTYRIVWSKRPYIIECVFILVQIIYDFFPFILLFRQHHNHFKQED